MAYDKEYYRKYRKRNKGRIAEKNRLWRLNNPQKERARQKRQRDSGYSARYQKEYRKTPQCKFSSLKSRAKQRGIEFSLAKDEFLLWFVAQSQRCIYCGIKLTVGENGNRKNWLTVDRKDNNRPYTMDNLTISCYRCNLIKSDDISYSTMLEIGKVIAKEKYDKLWNPSKKFWE